MLASWALLVGTSVKPSSGTSAVGQASVTGGGGGGVTVSLLAVLVAPVLMLPAASTATAVAVRVPSARGVTLKVPVQAPSPPVTVLASIGSVAASASSIDTSIWVLAGPVPSSSTAS